ncbi:MAG: alpha/beta fold hydrolase [Actinobacteria bacterium]|nr:alpha/beta fold hydrolase [Actinomycetota bacterium]
MAAARLPEHLSLRWHRTTLDGRDAFYGEAGDGPPLVFLHGWGVTSRSYARAIPTLAAAGARVIAPALPGFGQSDEVPGELTWAKLAGWIDDLLDHAGVDEPAFFVGHSFGGGVATMTAWHHPERVRSLVLVNSVGGASWKPERSLADRPIWNWGMHLSTEWTKRGYRRMLPVVVRDFTQNVLRHPANLWRAGRLAAAADMRGELAELAERELPITILWGTNDNILPEPAFAAMCEAVDATGDRVQGGHSWLLADPDGFGEVLTNSLAIHSLLTRARSATS